MKRCRASYHYLLRSLKSKKNVHVKQSVSKSLFQSSKRNYWKRVSVIRKKNYNTVPVIDNTRGDAAIAYLFDDIYVTLYNNVFSSSNTMKPLHDRIVAFEILYIYFEGADRIRGKITSQCDTCVNHSLHTHSVLITDVNR